MTEWATYRGVRLRELDSTKALGGIPQLEIKLDETELAGFRRQLAAYPGVLEAALLATTDKTRLFTRREIVKGLRGVAALTPAYIAKAVRSRKARQGAEGATAEVRVASRRFPLIRYEVNPQTPPPLKDLAASARSRTSYRLRGSGKTYGDTPKEAPAGAGGELSSLFVQRMKSGHVGVFYRVKSSGRIVQHYAPSVQYHMHADGFIDGIEQSSCEFFRTTLRQQVEAMTGQRLS